MSAKESLIVALGAGANLSLYGIGVWNGSTVLTDGSLLGPVAQPLADWYLLFATVGMLAGILARAAAACATGANGRFHMQTTLPAVLLATALLFSGLWTSGLPALCATAFCAGWSYACLHMFWMARISLTPEKARSVLPFVLLCSALANAWCASAPLESLHECLAIALLVSAACSVVLLAFDRTHGSPARSDVAARQPRADYHPLDPEASLPPCFQALRRGPLLRCGAADRCPHHELPGAYECARPRHPVGVVCAAQAVAAGVVFLALSRIKGPRCSIQFFKYVTPALILALFPSPLRAIRTLWACCLQGPACTSWWCSRCSARTPSRWRTGTTWCSSFSTPSGFSPSWPSALRSSTSCPWCCARRTPQSCWWCSACSSASTC